MRKKTWQYFTEYILSRQLIGVFNCKFVECWMHIGLAGILATFSNNLIIYKLNMIVIVIVIADVMGLEEDNRGSYSRPVCY